MVGIIEKRIVNKIRDTLKAEYPDMFIFKSSGGPFQRPGLPDLMMCVDGRFIGIEVKTPQTINKGLTKLQAETLGEINRAGGLGFACCSHIDALARVQQWMNTCMKNKQMMKPQK